MFRKIMIPVDLGHTEKLGKALDVGAKIAQSAGASICFVGVTGELPGNIAHNPKEYARKLESFAAAQGESHGVATESRAVAAHDPTVQLDTALLRAAREIGADLIVMQSHAPGFADHIFSAHGAEVARRAPISVLLVR